MLNDGTHKCTYIHSITTTTAANKTNKKIAKYMYLAERLMVDVNVNLIKQTKVHCIPR